MMTVVALIVVAVLGGVIGWVLERQRQWRQAIEDGASVVPARCGICGKLWVAVCDDGWDPTKGLECPRCGAMAGEPADEVEG